MNLIEIKKKIEKFVLYIDINIYINIRTYVYIFIKSTKIYENLKN